MVTLLYYCKSTCFTGTKVQILTPEALRARSLHHKVLEILLPDCPEVCRAHDDALVLLLFLPLFFVQRSHKACHLHYKACHLHLHGLKPYCCEPPDVPWVLVHMRVHESHNEELNHGIRVPKALLV